MSSIRTRKRSRMANANDESFIGEIWDILLPRFQDVFHGYGMTRVDYITLYTHVYNYCTNTKRVIAPNPNDKNERAGRRERAQAKQEQKDNLPHSFGTKAGDNPCYICRTKKPNHYSVKCPNVKKLERDDLMNIVKKDKLCSQCFIHGHLNKNKTCYFFTKKC